jgi:hypothetical protein
MKRRVWNRDYASVSNFKQRICKNKVQRAGFFSQIQRILLVAQYTEQMMNESVANRIISSI